MLPGNSLVPADANVNHTGVSGVGEAAQRPLNRVRLYTCITRIAYISRTIFT